MWTMEQIRVGLERFREEHGRYTDAYEVDAYPYLPSSRTIQRSHGGYIRVRKLLGLPMIHSGEYRSALQKQSNHRGKDIERDLYRDLVSRFGEEFVHREAPIGENGWMRLDCLVFTRQGKFGVDIFYAAKPHILKTTIVIKTREGKHYGNLGFPVFLVVANEGVMQQAEIDAMLANKKNPLPSNVRVLLRQQFTDALREYGRLCVAP